MQQAAGEPSFRVHLEVAVGDHQWDLAVAARQPEPVLLFVPDQVHADQPGEERPRRDVHRVIVVPQGGRRLVVEVLHDLRLAGELPVLRPSVLARPRDGAVQVHDQPRRDLGHVLAWRAPAEPRHDVRVGLHPHRRVDLHRGDRHPIVVDGVPPGHLQPLPAPHLDGRAGEVPAVGPQAGRRELRVQPPVHRTQVDRQPRPLRADDRRDAERVHERRQRDGDPAAVGDVRRVGGAAAGRGGAGLLRVARLIRAGKAVHVACALVRVVSRSGPPRRRLADHRHHPVGARARRDRREPRGHGPESPPAGPHPRPVFAILSPPPSDPCGSFPGTVPGATPVAIVP